MVRLLAALASSRMEAFGILEVAARFGKRQVLSNGRRSSGVVRRSLWAIGLRFGSFLACAPPPLASGLWCHRSRLGLAKARRAVARPLMKRGSASCSACPGPAIQASRAMQERRWLEELTIFLRCLVIQTSTFDVLGRSLRYGHRSRAGLFLLLLLWIFLVRHSTFPLPPPRPSLACAWAWLTGRWVAARSACFAIHGCARG